MPRAPDLSGVALDGRYELQALIGEGAFGRVYRAHDRRLKRAVAVKVIKPWWAEDPGWVEKFEREAQLLASISDPGIVQIFDVGSAPEGVYYVAELVEGESLADRLKRGPPAPGEARAIAQRLARALGRAHAQRVVHRDVKPANVLLGTGGEVKLGDFGVARLAEGSSHGAAGTVAGTPRYMAPEQARGGPTSPATDVYGVGVILYEMLAGRPPFDGETAVELALRHEGEAPPALPAAVPRALRRVVDRALEKDPASRYPDGTAMAAALSRAGHEADATLVAEPRRPRRIYNPVERRRRIVVTGAVLLILAAMVGGALVLGSVRTRVPGLVGLARTRVTAVLGHAGLRASFSSRYSDAPRDTAISQVPRAGDRVGDGSTVRVVLSGGPAPVAMPPLTGGSATDAQTRLGAIKLRGRVRYVPAPGVTPGTVTKQSPAAGAQLAPGSTVVLSVAEVPRWRALTSLAGDGAGHSVRFRIRGVRWRIVYSMSYRGTCTFLLFCSGPSATVADAGGAAVDHFGLGEGTGKAHSVTSGGLFQISVSPGSDTAHWSIVVEDLY